MMKKIILMLALTFTILSSVPMKWYSFLAIVVDVQEEIVTIKDTHGNLWQFEEDGWEINDVLDGYFYNNGTEEIEDDVITVKGKSEISSKYFEKIY